MVVGCVGFHSNFGVFKRSRHTKTVTRLAITNEFPFNPTYESGRGKMPRLPSLGGNSISGLAMGTLSRSLATPLITRYSLV